MTGNFQKNLEVTSLCLRFSRLATLAACWIRLCNKKIHRLDWAFTLHPTKTGAGASCVDYTVWPPNNRAKPSMHAAGRQQNTCHAATPARFRLRYGGSTLPGRRRSPPPGDVVRGKTYVSPACRPTANPPAKSMQPLGTAINANSADFTVDLLSRAPCYGAGDRVPCTCPPRRLRGLSTNRELADWSGCRRRRYPVFLSASLINHSWKDYRLIYYKKNTTK